MTAEEIIALGEAPTETTPVEDKSTKVEKPKAKPTPQPFPDDWPEPAVKRINQLHGQKIGLHTQLENERQQRVAVENKLREAEARARKAEADLPVYQKMAIEQGQARYEVVNERAKNELSNVFKSGNVTPDTLGIPIQNMIASELSKIELSRAAKQIDDAPKNFDPPPTQTTPQDDFDRLEAQGKTAVKKNVFLSDLNRFCAKTGLDLNAVDGTPEGMKKKAALQLDNSAVQLGYPVGSFAYWQHMEDGLRRAVPEDRSASGTEHTETVTEPVARKPVPSVAAPAARTNSMNTGGARQKISMSAEERQVMEKFLARNPKVPEADYLREWTKYKESER
jgi:hypothetical protein